ncbi:enoyl-CoA hydratase [Pseudomonas sp. SJZ103]|uniref:crotonase/enoyl-CoA hydratase family protein n=1 Tax=unclassified Pseudomonas TaxID=196821 RepID=UPI00119CAEDF|nr:MULTISPECIES: crotonase/enoyl-CoA hydratase family protein [unclassified Pseudomonas]MBB6290719.1 enoyl-CoA hydratase [Pseudomonas sp. SJZ073]MBB6315553.1 enoyl-CoA hydratase [Pseudomonas sp. JAI120]TWC61574.1 enoyl-CoA hydratase [Pseudomonas sp. SJZ103]TWC78770.1 enoyl-CoA hydratase [Pseudomonas sp. SJZ094]
MAKWLQSSECVTFEVADRVARITLNRPEKRNAINNVLLRELKQALLEADDLKSVNVIVLQGAGKDFCAGYDLVTTYGDLAEVNPTDYRGTQKNFDDDCWSMERQNETINLFAEIHKPIIARVHGNCLAGGTDLALACDMVLAADNARIGFPATRANGSPPAHMWFYHLGPQWAKRMLLTGDSLWGRDAAKLGLVLDAVPPEQLDEAVDELARRLSFVDADLLSANKRIVNLALELSGSKTLQRLAVENDSRAHQCQGPRRTQFKEDMQNLGLKDALKRRDEPFGDGMIKLYARGEE